MSRIIEMILRRYPQAYGIYHVSADPISKFDLLSMIKEHLNFSISIEPDEGFVCDRSLDSMKFRSEFGYKPPSWEAMVGELCEDIRLNHRDTGHTEK